VQRLDAALGAELLDCSVKPPRLNALGSRVLEHARDLLQRTAFSHPLAEGTLIHPTRALTEKSRKSAGG